MEWISTKEAAELLNEPIRNVQRWAEKKKIKSKMKDKKYLVSKTDIMSLVPSRKTTDDTTDDAKKDRQSNDKEATKEKDAATNEEVGTTTKKTQNGSLYPIPDGYVLIPKSVLENLDNDREQQRKILDKVLNLKAIPAASSASFDTPSTRQATTDEVDDIIYAEASKEGIDDTTNNVKMTRQGSNVPFGSKKALYWILGASTITLAVVAVIVYFMR